MSLLSTLSVSLSGIQTASTQLQIAANNIANAGQDGFTRKNAVVTTANLGEVGGGALITGFERAQNNVLFTTLTGATSDASYRSAQNDYLQQIQDLLGTSNSDNPPLSQDMAGFVNAWSQMSSEPESQVNQRQVVQAGVTLSDEIKRIASGVESLDRQCNNDISDTLNDLNNYLGQIKDLNQKISQAVNAGQSSGDLQDSRDKLVQKIAEITGVTVLQRNFGQIAIYTSTGYQLVDGSSARSFAYDGADITSSANPGLSLNTALSGSRLQALIDFRSISTPVSTDPSVNVIQKLRSQLDSFVSALTTTITTATSGAATFASAYDNAAAGTDAVASHRTLTNAFTLTATTAGAAGNNLSITIADGSTPGTNYTVTVSNGTTNEVYTDLTAVPSLWSNIVDAINNGGGTGPTPASTLVTAAVNGTGALDPTTLTLPVNYTLYGGADQGSPNELASGFFTGTDRTSFAVNAALLNGTATVKVASAGVVTDALLDATRSFTADGLSISSSNYAHLVSGSLTNFQQAANNVLTLKSTAESRQAYLQQKLSNETGVNIDTEMVNLITLQQAYSASARTISVVRDLFQQLETLLN